MEMRSPQKNQLGKIMRALSGAWPPHLASLILWWRDDAGLALSSSAGPFPPDCMAEHLVLEGAGTRLCWPQTQGNKQVLPK